MPNMQNILERSAPGCSMGILIVRNACGSPAAALDDEKRNLEDSLRAAYGAMGRKELASLRPMDAYASYYKRFGYTYHVLGQLESILQGKTIPGGIPLVAAMFMAEMKNMLLTAGHDLDQVVLPLRLDACTGREEYVLMNGKSAAAVPGDFMLSDGEGPLSSILRGPAQRARITEYTTNALYTVYAPQGVAEELVLGHLEDMETYIRLFSARSVTQAKEFYPG